MAPPSVRPQTEGEAKFTTLKGEVDRTKRPKAARAAWISQATWQMADQKTAIKRAGRVSTTEVQKLQRDF